MLVLDVSPGDRRLTEELFGFSGRTPRRFMLWSLRGFYRRDDPREGAPHPGPSQGIVTGSWEYKSEVLRDYIRDDDGSLEVRSTVSSTAFPNAVGR